MDYDKKAFKAWLEENLKNDDKGSIWLTHDFQAYCDDLETAYGEIGQPRYELRGYETKSGHPEEYTYEITVSTSEFIKDLFENMRIIPESYSMEDAEDDLANFRADGWNMPDLTARVLYDAIQQLIAEQMENNE